MHNPKSSGRLIKWAIELVEFDIKFKIEEDLEMALKEYWVLCFDGASTKISGASLVLQRLEGFIVEYVLNLDFPTSYNEVKYEDLIARIVLAPKNLLVSK